MIAGGEKNPEGKKKKMITEKPQEGDVALGAKVECVHYNQGWINKRAC